MTISSDSPEQTAAGMGKHGARAVMLADPELEVTRRFNLIHPTRLAPPPMTELPIPTTILVDAEGIVRWIDQADDYQIRSEPDRVLAALQAHLPA